MNDIVRFTIIKLCLCKFHNILAGTRGKLKEVVTQQHQMIQLLTEKVRALEAENKSLHQQLKAAKGIHEQQFSCLDAAEHPELLFHHITSRCKHEGANMPVS